MPSPEYANRDPGSKWIFNLRSSSIHRQFANPLVWLSSMRAVTSLYRASFARSEYFGYSGSGFGKY